MSDLRSTSAPKTIQQRFGAQVGKFNNWYGDLDEGRYTLTFDRSVSNRVNLHAGSPDEPAVASALFREEPDDAGSTGWFTNDGQVHRTLHEAAEHMISIRAQPRGEITGDDATEVQGHPANQGVGLSLAAAAMALGPGAGQLLPHHQVISRTLGKGKFKLRPKQRSSYNLNKASVTDQYKGSPVAKKAAYQAKKAQKAAKRARRAKKMEKNHG